MGMVLLSTPIFPTDPDIRFFTMILLLLIAGISVGNVISLTLVVTFPFISETQIAGRFTYFAYIFICGSVVLAAIIDSFGILELYSLYLLIVFLAMTVFIYTGRESLDELPERAVSIEHYLRKREIYPVLLLAFFIGFFFTNTYFASVLIFINMGHLENFWLFVAILFVVATLVCFPAGLLYDTIGRRWSILIGFYIQALAFLILSFFPLSIENPMFWVFPAVLGVGFALSIFGGIIYVFELGPKGFTRIHAGMDFTFFGFGMIIGVVTDSALQQLLIDNPVMLPFVLVFALFTATIVVLQLRETLPSQEELAWKKKIEQLLVVSKGGLPLYTQRLGKSVSDESGPDEMLVSGAISGITELVREISRSASKLKVIQQEGYCILLEEGKECIVAVMALEELNAIRSRMIDFLEDFESFYGTLISEWEGDTRLFAPTKQLVTRHFD
jgi:hypothetical protein